MVISCVHILPAGNTKNHAKSANAMLGKYPDVNVFNTGNFIYSLDHLFLSFKQNADISASESNVLALCNRNISNS